MRRRRLIHKELILFKQINVSTPILMDTIRLRFFFFYTFKEGTTKQTDKEQDL